MKSLRWLIIVILHCSVVSISYAAADYEEKSNFSANDYILYGNVVEAINNLGDLKREIEDELLYRDSDGSKAQTLRKYARGIREISDSLKDMYPSVENIDLRRLYREFYRDLDELVELNLVGATLLEAREINNTKALASLAASLATNEAKHLASPILSRIELEIRIQKFIERLEARRKEMLRHLNILFDRVDRIQSNFNSLPDISSIPSPLPDIPSH